MPVDAMPKTASYRAALIVVVYVGCVGALVGRIAWLDGWSMARYAVLGLFVATAARDRVMAPSVRSLVLGVLFFASLCAAVTYLPELWFSIAYSLNHAKDYLWNANSAMARLPGNDAGFLWRHQAQPLTQWMAWTYENGFDMVVWIPVVRSLLAFDSLKTARYALAAHILQFPMIMPFYATIRVDEVWSVLGHADLLQRGWSNEVRMDLGANCFPSMHTSVAFAILLLGLREKSVLYRVMIVLYATAIIVSTMYMQVHWVIDVLAGLLLGWTAVKVTDALLGKLRGMGRLAAGPAKATTDGSSSPHG
jgi:membrane-associated phospholipid phosphatase